MENNLDTNCTSVLRLLRSIPRVILIQRIYLVALDWRDGDNWEVFPSEAVAEGGGVRVGQGQAIASGYDTYLTIMIQVNPIMANHRLLRKLYYL